MSCSNASISTTVQHGIGSRVAEPIVEPILSDTLAQLERAKYEIGSSYLYKITLTAKPREVSKGDIIAIQESLFNSIIYGVVESVEYRLTVDDDSSIQPSMSLSVLVAQGM